MTDPTGREEPGASRTSLGEAAARVAARALEHIRVLSVDIGPRGSATEGERKGSEYAEAELGRWARDVEVQPFRCSYTYSHPWGAVGLLLVLSGALLGVSPVVALVLALLNLLLYLPLASGRGEVGRLFPQRASRNVWGVVPARGGAGVTRRRVVLMAHVDSTRAALLYKPSQLKNLRFNHMLNLASVLAAPVLALLALVLEGPALLVVRVLGGVIALIAGYGLLTLVHRETLMPYVHGANDNASGVGLTLALGEHYASKPLEATELWCVVTGCEESGYPAGARRFVDRHLSWLRDAEVIVLDNIGAGDLRHLTREGIILPLAMDGGLLGLARRLGRRHPDWNIRDSECDLGYTDATPVLAKGCRALVLWAEGEDGLLKNYHWPTDVFENVEPGTITRAAELVMELIEAIDRGEHRKE
ncbi:MAG: M28 family peptidase [Firmicutes bacterium]|nr:M28 family peptidase [Bacillota bacterium]